MGKNRGVQGVAYPPLGAKKTKEFQVGILIFDLYALFS